MNMSPRSFSAKFQKMRWRSRICCIWPGTHGDRAGFGAATVHRSGAAAGSDPLASVSGARGAARAARQLQPLPDLIRGGKLYLTAQDAIALALENNIDIEVARYNPISLEWSVERAQAGGALPGVPSGATQANSVASGQGVLGSQAAAGVSTGGNANSRTSGNATITQVGPVAQTFDPSIQGSTVFSHKTTPAVRSGADVQPHPDRQRAHL